MRYFCLLKVHFQIFEPCLHEAAVAVDAAKIAAVIGATTHLKEKVLHAAVGAPIMVEVMVPAKLVEVAKLTETAKPVEAARSVEVAKIVAEATIVAMGEDEAIEVDEAVKGTMPCSVGSLRNRLTTTQT